jgi:hypothetical protein
MKFLQNDGRLIHFVNQNMDLIEEFTEWKERLADINNPFTFEKTLKFCDINWKFTNDNWTTRAKKKWLGFIRKWNATNINPSSRYNQYSTYGYIAITYLYISIPYGSLERRGPACENISEFLARLINICLLHEFGDNLITFKDYGMITFEEIEKYGCERELSKQYNLARWFFMFLIFLKEKRIDIGSPMAMWSSY